MHHFPQRTYFEPRQTQEELCRDFPADRTFIGGLERMQSFFSNRNQPIQIPILRTMNLAHTIIAYMLSNECLDQFDYDYIAYDGHGHDDQLKIITLIVVAAMLARTDNSFRATVCRDLVLERRPQDFYEGVTLYDDFLRSTEKRFAEEDFLTDIPNVIEQMKEKDEIINQQAHQIQQLQYTITTMEEKSNNTQIIIYQAPVYQGCSFTDSHDTINNYTTPVAAAEQTATPATSPLFTQKARTEGKESEIIEALQRSFAGRSDKARALVTEIAYWQQKGYIDSHFNAKVMYDELARLITIPFQYAGFRKYYNE